MKRHPFRTILITALISSAATIVMVRWNLFLAFSGGPSAEPTQAAIADTPARNIPLSDEEKVNIEVYDRISSGVVNITSIVVEYDFFFSPFAKPGTGSGSILDLDGNIVTNYHVIRDTSALEVTLPDQSKYRATIVGTDPQNDLAVIKLVGAPGEKLNPIPLADSE